MISNRFKITLLLTSAALLLAWPVTAPLTNPAPVLSGGQYLLALPATNTMSFFRLNCP